MSSTATDMISTPILTIADNNKIINGVCESPTDRIILLSRLYANVIGIPAKIIKTYSYDDKAYQEFRNKYLPEKLGKSTKLIVDYIIKEMKK